jgi:hypothetical protein
LAVDGAIMTWPGYAPFFAHGFNAKMLNAKPGVALEILSTLAGSR